MATRTPSKNGPNILTYMRIRHLYRIAFGLPSVSSSTRGAMNAHRRNWRKGLPRVTLDCFCRFLIRRRMMCSLRSTLIHWLSRCFIRSSMPSPSREPSSIIASRNSCLLPSRKCSLVLKSAIKSITTRNGRSTSELETSSQNGQKGHKAKPKSHLLRKANQSQREALRRWRREKPCQSDTVLSSSSTWKQTNTRQEIMFPNSRWSTLR